MVNKKEVLNIIGLANRAGFIVSGEDAIKKALPKNKLKIVFVANDASSRTIDQFLKKCYFYKVNCSIDFSSLELSMALGKPRKIVGLTDQGFYVSVERLMR